MLLIIEKLIYGGDGLARLPSDAAATEKSAKDHARGKAAFIPFTLAGEKIEAAITEQKPGFVRARVENVVEASPYRIEPACPYYTRCGGCHYQHSSYEHQLEIKQEILRENFRRIAKLELDRSIAVHPSPPWNYRNRSRFQVRTQSEFAAGYFRLSSHELLPVEQCPISSPMVNRGLAALWELGRKGQVPDGVREVEFFANADDAQLLVEVFCGTESRRAAVRDFAEVLRDRLPAVAGLVASREPERSAKSLAKQEIFVSLGQPHLDYRTARATYRVSAGGFFQTNRHLIDELVRIVTEGRSGELALDLYAGMGLFSTPLACDVRHIVSVESSQTSAEDLAYNRPSNGEIVRADVEEYLSPERGRSLHGRSLLGKSSQAKSSQAKPSNRALDGAGKALPLIARQPDLVVVDPPRSGLGDRVVRSLAGLGAARITYVSCDPATLARDLVVLLGANYRVEQVHLVDLFPQTYHLETVVQLVR